MKRSGLMFHIPKTAGNAVVAALKDTRVLTTGHGSLDTNLEVAGKKLVKAGLTWGDVFTFAFVRNPWDRMVSWYYHTITADREGWIQDKHIHHFRLWCAHRGGKELRQHAPGVALVDDQGRTRVDFVGQYEFLAADLETIAESLNVKVTKIPVQNPGRRRPAWARDFKLFYDTRSAEIVASASQWEIEKFSYSIHGPRSLPPEEIIYG